MRFIFAYPKLAAIAIFCVLMVAAILNRQYRVGAAEDEARQGFLAVCERDRPNTDCAERLESEHQRCFAGNYSHGGKYSSASLNTQGYRQCVSDGYEAWNRRRIEENRDAEKFRKETLG